MKYYENNTYVILLNLAATKSKTDKKTTMNNYQNYLSAKANALVYFMLYSQFDASAGNQNDILLAIIPKNGHLLHENHM